MSLTVDLIGDSHLYWLKEADITTGIARRENTRWHTKRGGRYDFLLNALDVIEWEVEADITVIMLGGNDLDQPDLDIRALANKYIIAFNRLETAGKVVLYMKAWPRPGARHGSVNYWTNVNFFEHLIDRYCWAWQWDKSLKFTDNFFAHDGVHCKKSRLKKVYRYLTSAVLAVLKQLERH